MNGFQGGIVSAAFLHPPARGIIAIQGTWSGGEWTSEDDLKLLHFRKGVYQGKSRVVGVEIIHSRNVILLVKGPPSAEVFAAGDTVAFGEGTSCTVLDVKSSTLPVVQTTAVQIGAARFNAVVKVDGKVITEIAIFHSPAATMWRFDEQPVFWNGKKYEIRIALTGQGASFELRINKPHVQAKALLDTLKPLRAFALDAGQLILTAKRASRKRAMVYEYFEPNVTVAAGSVRVTVHPGTPKQLPLAVGLAEPLQLLISAVSQAANGHADGVISVLRDRVSSIEKLLAHLHDFAKAAVRHGDVDVYLNDNESSISIGQKFEEIIDRAIAGLQTRRVAIGCELYGIDTTQGWIRVKSQDELWTISYPRQMKVQIEGRLVPRYVYIVFSTTALPESRGGHGELIDFYEAGTERGNQTPLA